MKLFYICLSLSLMIVTSCNKDAECNCAETYEGAVQNWTAEFDTVLIGVKRKEANEQCDLLDDSSTLLSETYTIDCQKK